MRLLPLSGGVARARDHIQHEAGDLRGQVCVARVRGPDRADQLVRCAALEYEAGRAFLDRAPRVRLGTERRQQHDPDSGYLAADRRGRRQPV
jgi:hypothetical protein